MTVHCITWCRGSCAIKGTLKHIRHLLYFDRDNIFHIYREENQVADTLASDGQGNRHYQEYGPHELPRQFRALVLIDLDYLALEVCNLGLIYFCCTRSIHHCIPLSNCFYYICYFVAFWMSRLCPPPFLCTHLFHDVSACLKNHDKICIFI